MDLTTATPVEIDTAIAEIFERLAPLYFNVERAQEDVRRITKNMASPRAYLTQANVDRALANLSEAMQAANLVEAECDPFEAEFARRGGWTRAFLVLNTNGHIHSSRACSTCFLTTRYGWLPQVSGFDEAEIVAQAGQDACTVCYPTAPVEKRIARTLLHSSEVAAQAARDERAAAKAARDVVKAAKALEIDLRPFGVDGYVGRIHTLAAAKSYLTDAAEYEGWGRTHPYYPAAAVQAVAEAVAAKVGTTPAEETAAAAKRAAKRR
jgi:hypothetical protein